MSHCCLLSEFEYNGKCRLSPAFRFYVQYGFGFALICERFVFHAKPEVFAFYAFSRKATCGLFKNLLWVTLPVKVA